MSLATATATRARPAMRAATYNPGTQASGTQASGSLEGFFRELAPDWHSQWAWDNYEETILGLTQKFGLRRVCEIGGGRDPLFTAEQAKRRGIDLIVNDIDAGELALTPAGLRTARFDIAGDLSELSTAVGFQASGAE